MFLPYMPNRRGSVKYFQQKERRIKAQQKHLTTGSIRKKRERKNPSSSSSEFFMMLLAVESVISRFDPYNVSAIFGLLLVKFVGEFILLFICFGLQATCL